MKPCLAGAVAALFLFFAASAPALAVEASEAPGAKPLAVGSLFPDVPLIGPLAPEPAAALGLPTNGPRTIATIAADVLIVEMFSMYCPFCQRDAPAVNALAALIESRGLGGRVKLIGIGAGNSDAEVDVFRKKFQIPFALFSDAAFAVHSTVGQVGTPFFYALRKTPQGYTIIDAHLGRLADPAAYLDAVLAKANL